ncbi:hypothetical protein pb186bvf_018736 [Paramecium bursaria]
MVSPSALSLIYLLNLVIFLQLQQLMWDKFIIINLVYLQKISISCNNQIRQEFCQGYIYVKTYYQQKYQQKILSIQ